MNELNLFNVRCPMSIIKINKAARDMRHGDSLTVLTNDAGTEKDLKAFCAQRNFALAEHDYPDGKKFVLVKG